MTGRVVVVTGAAGGIGAALARGFAGRGAHVALLDRDIEGARVQAERLEGSAGEALALPCDVTSQAQCAAALAAVVERWGGVDILVNNAGITQLGAFRDTQVEVVRRVMEVNFFGALHCTKAALPSLVARGGQLVVVSSVAGFAPLALRCAYAASKHALHGFFDSLRAEHERDGLGVLIVCPSFVDTAIGEHALTGDGRPAPPQARTGVRRAADPEHVAHEIIQAALARRRLLLVPAEARLSYWVSRLTPGLYERMMIRRTLPATRGRSAD